MDHDDTLPDLALPNVTVFFSFATTDDLFARVNQLELDRDAVGWDRLTSVNVDGAHDGVVPVEAAVTAFEINAQSGEVKFRFSCSHFLYLSPTIF